MKFFFTSNLQIRKKFGVVIIIMIWNLIWFFTVAEQLLANIHWASLFFLYFQLLKYCKESTLIFISFVLLHDMLRSHLGIWLIAVSKEAACAMSARLLVSIFQVYSECRDRHSAAASSVRCERYCLLWTTSERVSLVDTSLVSLYSYTTQILYLWCSPDSLEKA